MVDKEHPIAPPSELAQQWASESLATQSLCNRAAQWGADQELEACCEWLINEGHEYEHVALHAARRPKSPSLKEQALKALDDISIASFEQDAANTIRYALEQLDD